MRIFFTTYKYSVIATLMDVAGSLASAAGIYLLVEELFKGNFMHSVISFFVLALGIGMKFLASHVNDKVFSKKMRKALVDPVLISKIKKSAVAAYSLYKNQPSKLTFALVSEHNPFATMRIAEINTNTLSEAEAIDMMKQYDSIIVNGETPVSSDIHYSNKMFKITNL